MDIVNHVGFAPQITVTRTADTNAYTAGDVIGPATGSTAAIEFPGIGFANNHGIIMDTDLRIDLAAVPATMTSFRLHLYSVTPPSALGDNVAWDLPAGDRASYLGYVDLGTPVDVGSTLFVQTSGVNKKFALGATGSIFGYLITNGAYTPTSACTHAIRLNTVNMG